MVTSLVGVLDSGWRYIHSNCVEAQGCRDEDRIISLQLCQYYLAAQDIWRPIKPTLPQPGTRARPLRGHSSWLDIRRLRNGGCTAPLSQGVTSACLYGINISVYKKH
jgi:hypothetical protein